MDHKLVQTKIIWVELILRKKYVTDHASKSRTDALASIRNNNRYEFTSEKIRIIWST